MNDIIIFAAGLMSGTILLVIQYLIEKKNVKHFIGTYLSVNIDRLNNYIEMLSNSNLEKVPAASLPFDSNLFFNTISKFRFKEQRKLYQIGVSLEIISKSHADFFSIEKLTGGSFVGFLISHYTLNIVEPYLEYFNFDNVKIKNDQEGISKLANLIREHGRPR